MPHPLSADVLLGPNAGHTERLTRAARVFSKTNSILAKRNIKVALRKEGTGSAPAWSDGDTVYFNTDHIRDTDFDDIMRVYGLNFHEMAHVFYTPRMSHPVPTRCKEESLWEAFNALEDQRIETLLTRRWPSTAPWLTATVGRWLLDSTAAVIHAYPLVRGRRYLPGELRGLLREQYLYPSRLGVIDSVIDEYREIRFKRQAHNDRDVQDRAVELIRLYHEAVFGAPAAGPNGTCTGMTSGGTLSDSEQAAANNDSDWDEEVPPTASGDDRDDDKDSDTDGHTGGPCCACHAGEEGR